MHGLPSLGRELQKRIKAERESRKKIICRVIEEGKDKKEAMSRMQNAGLYSSLYWMDRWWAYYADGGE